MNDLESGQRPSQWGTNFAPTPFYPNNSLIVESPAHESRSSAVWHVCCQQSPVERSFVTYIVQMIFVLTILIFCFVQVTRKPREDATVYFSLMSWVIGVVMPHPRIKRTSRRH